MGILAGRAIVTDDFDVITGQLREWVADKGVDVIVATGGTGLTGRDGTLRHFVRFLKRKLRGLANYFVISHSPRLALLRYNHVPLRWQMGLICSRFRVTIGVAMDGMRYYAIS